MASKSIFRKRMSYAIYATLAFLIALQSAYLFWFIHSSVAQDHKQFSEVSESTSILVICLLVLLVLEIVFEIRKKNNQIENIIKSSPAILYTCVRTDSGAYQATYVSDSIQNLGYKPNDFISDSQFWFSNVHPEHREMILKKDVKSKDQNKIIWEYKFRKKDGTYIWMRDNFTLIRDKKGVPIEIIGFWIDITGEMALKNQSQSLFEMIDKTSFQNEIEAASHCGETTALGDCKKSGDLTSKDFFNRIETLTKLHTFVDSLKVQAAVFTNSSEGIIIMNGRGIINAVNPSFEKMSGYTSSELLGKSLHSLYKKNKDVKLRKAILAALLKNNAWKGELKNKRKNGENYSQSIALSTIRNHEGKIIEFVAVTGDITARINAEDELRRTNITLASATNAKTNFISNISHEIRTPLNAIIGLSDLLSTSELTKEQSEYLDRIIKSGHALLELINNVLDLSKIESGAIELENKEFNLQVFIREIYDMFEMRAVNKGLSFKLEVAPEVPREIIGDAIRLRQVLVNLIGNSIKFTQRGGCIFQVLVQELKGSSIKVAFRIKDTGIGIPNDQIDRLFDRFNQIDNSVTKQFGGSGLGLSIAKELVEIMQGEIRVQSVLAVGSEFEVVMPLTVAKEELKPIAPQLKPVPVDSRNLKLLVVDDTDDNRLLIKAYMSKLPYQLDFAVNGEEAVQLYQTKPFDLILMDMQMPIMDGYTATQKIREIEKEKQLNPVHIIALTGFALNVEKEKSLKAGCNLHMTKPIKRNDLIQAILNESGYYGSNS